MPTETEIQLLTSDEFFAAIAFVAPRSPQWPLVRGLCQQADGIAVDKNNVTVAFRKKRESIQLFIVICDIVQQWKSAHIFVQKKKISYVFSVKWLQCYLKSLQCDDKLAWCLHITKGPKPISDFSELTLTLIIEQNPYPLAEKKPEQVDFEEHFICPCRNLSHYNWGHRELPSSMKHQFQAFAVEQGYADCPNFDIDEFKAVFNTKEI